MLGFIRIPELFKYIMCMRNMKYSGILNKRLKHLQIVSANPLDPNPLKDTNGRTPPLFFSTSNERSNYVELFKV